MTLEGGDLAFGRPPPVVATPFLGWGDPRGVFAKFILNCDIFVLIKNIAYLLKK